MYGQSGGASIDGTEGADMGLRPGKSPANIDTPMDDIRHDWTDDQARAIYELPIPELIHRAQATHRRYHDANEVQLCTLLSIKTGGCSEDCGYCSQSARHATTVAPEPLMEVEAVLSRARKAKDAGATRFCMGAAWRRARGGAHFERVLEMIRGVRSLGMEACVTLGMLTDEQVAALKEAGLTAYNHNLDTSEAYYDQVVTTHTYTDRLSTLRRVADAGISMCCGGILGMGETVNDRMSLLTTLARLRPHPESVPINALVAIDGTPLQDRPPIDPLELVRMCGAARVMLPKARVRLSAGRTTLSREAQLLCFLAGANSIFFGEKLLTTGNPDTTEDLALLRDAGLRASTLERHEARPQTSSWVLNPLNS